MRTQDIISSEPNPCYEFTCDSLFTVPAMRGVSRPEFSSAALLGLGHKFVCEFIN